MLCSFNDDLGLRSSQFDRAVRCAGVHENSGLESVRFQPSDAFRLWPLPFSCAGVWDPW